jgi:hypothetical protein
MFSQRFSHLAGPALTLGGLLWVTIHVMIVIAGVMTGKLVIALAPAQQQLLAHIYYLVLPISYLILCAGLLGAFVHLEGRAGRLGITGFVFASIATLSSSINLIFLPISTTSLGGVFGVAASVVNGLSGLSALAATLLLGCAALRTHLLPAPFAWTLIVIGIVTLPILLLTPLPIGPDWATDTISFFLSGVGYTVVGLRMLAPHKCMDQHKGEASISLASQAK